MSEGVSALVAKVTKHRSAESDRFQCSDVYQLWDDGQVTVDHCVEDQEWGGVDETREVAETAKLPRDFFKLGFSREIDRAGAVRDMLL